MRASNARDLTTVASAEFENGAFAVASYVEQLPSGYGFDDVDWIAWATPLDALPPNPQLEALVPGFRPVFASDDFLVQLRAVTAGVGAMFLGGTQHRLSLLSSLCQLDLDLGQHRRGSLHLIGAKRALEIPRVRAVADRIAAELEAIEP